MDGSGWHVAGDLLGGRVLDKVVVKCHSGDPSTKDWCLKSKNIGFAKTIVSYFQNLDFLIPRIDYQKGMHDTL